MSSRPLCIQINWQQQCGGGEVYTRFFTQALISLGWDVEIIVHRSATFWREFGLKGVRFLPVVRGSEIPGLLPRGPAVVVTHTTLPPELASTISARYRLGGFLHMPLHERMPGGLAHYHRIFPVSTYVRGTALARGLQQVHAQPLLGVADLAPRTTGGGAIVRHSEYDWDLRKMRDRVLSWAEPLRTSRRRQVFSRRPGIALGIVSRLTPIKQFPLLFSLLAPVLSDYPEIHLEVFGSGGYSSVRDLRRSLGPILDRTRFWGHQPDPAAVYGQLDYVLSGLPEREALGLNLIEAQAAGTPVIAVDAPPFVETVMPGASGFLYADPRDDGGESFRTLMTNLNTGMTRPDPRVAKDHLSQFSPQAFRERVACAMSELRL